MKVSIERDEVRLEVSGLENLKLKAALYNRIGSNLRAEKSLLAFPSSCLPILQDLLPENISSQEEIERASEKYRKHGMAREQALRIVDQNLTDGVSEDWLQRLDLPQAVAVSAMISPDLLGMCLFDEQGSGKTVMTIAAFDLLKSAGIVDAMIVVCPKTMISEWPKDIDRFLPSKYIVRTAEGDRHEKYQTAMKDFDVIVTNYEGVDHIQVALSATASMKSYLLVVDESYYMKNSESIRSDAARKLRASCKKCFVLCGTPAPNSPYDLVNQFDLADLGYTFGSFRQSRDEEGDRVKIESLIENRGAFIRRLKTEVLDEIPEKNFHIIKVRMSGKQAMMYETARKSLELELRGLDNSKFRKSLATYFQKRAALLQICACPSAIDPTMTGGSAKLESLDELLERLIGQKRKVLMWSYYKKNIDELVERYAKYQPIRVDGSVNVSDRREAVRAFQEDADRMLFIGNPAAAGAGITLHAAFDAVYVSYSNQAAHYLQSLDRIHRRGQKSKEVNYYLLVCDGTIEETEVIRLRGKELQQHSLLGDHIPWPTSLDEALQELSPIGI